MGRLLGFALAGVVALSAGVEGGLSATRARSACFGPAFPEPGALGVTGVVGKELVLMRFPANDATAGQIILRDPPRLPPGIEFTVSAGQVVVSGTPTEAGTFTFHLWWSAPGCTNTNHNHDTFYYYFTVVAGKAPSASPHATWSDAEVEGRARIALAREKAAEKKIAANESPRPQDRVFFIASYGDIKAAASELQPVQDVPTADRAKAEAVVRDLTTDEKMMMTVIEDQTFSPASYAPVLTDIQRAVTATEQLM